MEILQKNPGALWTEELLERCRLPNPSPSRGEGQVREAIQGEGASYGEGAGIPSPSAADAAFPSPPQGEGSSPFTRLVIAVDPPTGDGTCGIIACARDSHGKAHILADHSVTAQSPEAWSRAVADSAHLWGQSLVTVPLPVLVVAESNQGGLMVQSVLRISDPALNIKLVPAIQGKSDRAAPVAMLFEAGMVAVHGRFPELEAQLCGMIAGGDYEGPGTSPDRADAMVWGLTELMLQKERAEPRIRRL
ncbi:MAG TPA: hypothetical protein VF650_00550 [Allosphingosinicella sp.]